MELLALKDMLYDIPRLLRLEYVILSAISNVTRIKIINRIDEILETNVKVGELR